MDGKPPALFIYFIFIFVQPFGSQANQLQYFTSYYSNMLLGRDVWRSSNGKSTTKRVMKKLGQMDS